MLEAPTDEERRQRRLVGWATAGIALVVAIAVGLSIVLALQHDAPSPAEGRPPGGSKAAAGAPRGLHGEPVVATGTGAVLAAHAEKTGSTGSVLGNAASPVVNIPKTRHRFTMRAGVAGVLTPGAPRALIVTITNPNGFRIKLLTVKVTVRKPAAPGCLPGWVKVTNYAFHGGRGIVAQPHSQRVVDLPIRLVNLKNVNQNACQGATFPLALRGTAAQVVGR